jgi:hypothetical protein
MKTTVMSMKSLAVRYFPDITPKSASIRLRQWIKDDQDLLSRLRLNGFRQSQKILKPKQVKLITEAFGDPE